LKLIIIEKEVKNNMNKKYMMFGMFALLAVGLVSAGYLVDSFFFTVGVAEPFTVQYGVLGDSGDYDEEIDGTCANPSDPNFVWFDSTTQSIPTGDMFPGESRKLCVKIVNEGESAIHYDVTSQISENSNENCSLAFPETTIPGDAPNGETITGLEFTVPGSAPVVSGCEVGISVTRG